MAGQNRSQSQLSDSSIRAPDTTESGSARLGVARDRAGRLRL
ncbi:unannotated protein [freshwater metagenome]|uniref:Unannotated protein n=1 Tax=freshwater metagenome TaxID=449393 RepID=A0A6J6BRD4_9ZZZZ